MQNRPAFLLSCFLRLLFIWLRWFSCAVAPTAFLAATFYPAQAATPPTTGVEATFYQDVAAAGQRLIPALAGAQASPGTLPAPSKRRAKNVILIVGDAGGIPTLHAASLYAHGTPQGLFIHTMPFMALMDTSAANAWVTDSAAGATALVTGSKTNTGVLSQSASAVRGRKDGDRLKTILEYAEEKGLSTGVMSNVPVIDATTAACFAHVNNRGDAGQILSQFLAPSFGDGVDLLIGPGRSRILAEAEKAGIDFEKELQQRGYAFCDDPSQVLPTSRRTVALFESQDFDLPSLVQRAIDILSLDEEGYFLLAECDVHTDRLRPGLERVVVLDRIVRETAARAGDDTLVIFLADHSFDIRVRGGKPGEPLLPPSADAGEMEGKGGPVRVDDGHTGEQVLVAAQGPGAELVKGFIVNTDIFRIMMAAYGWKAEPPGQGRR